MLQEFLVSILGQDIFVFTGSMLGIAITLSFISVIINPSK
jgi:hypothetical protein